jgi:hypothetical protein
VNERIREVNGSFTAGGAPAAIDVFCECGQNGCLERLQVPATVYEDTRDREGHFLVSHGHEDRERVLQEGETYRVVVLEDRQQKSDSEQTLLLQPEPIVSEPS